MQHTIGDHRDGDGVWGGGVTYNQAPLGRATVRHAEGVTDVEEQRKDERDRGDKVDPTARAVAGPAVFGSDADEHQQTEDNLHRGQLERDSRWRLWCSEQRNKTVCVSTE